MKKLAIALTASLFLFASCGKKSDHEHGEDTHTHEDGTTHSDHADTTKQEEFNASDSTGHHHDSTDHKHPHN